MSTVYNYFLLMIVAGLCDLYAGIPLLDNQQESRPSSRFRRYSGLCPSGISREACFYSQLDVFMKIHDSMMDPVSLRNIGKRNGDHNMAKELLTEPFLEIFSHTKHPFDEENINTMDNSIPQGFYSKLVDADRISLPKFVDTYAKRVSQIIKGERNGIEEEFRNNPGRVAYLPEKSKRHIICPASMSRVECYDQAMAFYMRIMQSVGKQ